MAAVLFIVTIPTEAEEERLKLEFIAKKFDLRPDQVDVGLAVKTENTTTESTSTPTTIFRNDNGIINDYADTVSQATIDSNHTPSAIIDNNNVNVNGGEQLPGTYGTFPKRRKAAHKAKLLDELGSQSVGGSLKDVNAKDVNLKDVNTLDELPAARKNLEGFRDFLSSAKRKNLKNRDQHKDTELTEDTCMEIVVREILKKFQVQGAVWSKDAGDRMHQIFFTVEFNEIYEKLLDNFNEWGIGDREGSTVSVMNCIASKTYSQKDDDLQNDFSAENNIDQKQSAWERFMNSVQSRLNVANIVRDVRQDATITFDFVVLVISAAILASFGLVEDSTIFLASSMLISPLMGPIIAAIFGTVIKDMSLGKLGLINELYGILMAVLVGFLFGIIVCTTDDRYSIGEGLTEEMVSRCELHSLIVGIFTAIPSGAAAAVGILGGNVGSLVGVAISASLLPPAVNSGLLWALAVISKFFENDDSRYNNVVKSSLYSKDQATELAILGSISMCLTISNIICIYIMGIIVLKVKEIAPVVSRNREFWKRDIKIARNLNRNGYDSETAIIDEFANLPKEDQKALGLSSDFLRNIHMDEAAYQNTWSPLSGRHPIDSTYEPMRQNYSTVHRIDRLYSTIQRQQSVKEKRNRFSVTRKPTGRANDFAANYHLLSENIPRSSTMPSKVVRPGINFVTPDATITASSGNSDSKYASETNTPTGMTRRTFIVTPAEEDPLHNKQRTTDNV